MPEIGQPNKFCTEDSVRVKAAALTELVDCPDPSTCDICIFANYYLTECIALQCPHRHYFERCIHCCTRRHIEIYTNPTAFVKAHCNPNPETWKQGFPTVYTKSAGTYTRKSRERYTTPRSKAQDRRRNDWTNDQQLSLALAYYTTGQKLGAPLPKVEEETMNKAQLILQPVNPDNQDFQTAEKENNTNNETVPTDTQPTTPDQKPPTVELVQHTQSQTADIDTETQELIQQVLKMETTKQTTNYEETSGNQENKTQEESTPAHTPRINMVRLCLCNNPQCPARKGQRTTNTTQNNSNPNPHIAQTQIRDNRKTKTIQLQYEEYATFTWEHSAAYIDCHGQNSKIKALIDTGSCISILSYDKAKEITSHPDWETSGGHWNHEVYIKAYSCSNTLLKLVGRITLPHFSLNKEKPFPKGASFWVLQDASEECILAGQWLLDMKAIISMQQHTLYYTLPQEHLSAGADEFIIETKSTENTPENTKKEILEEDSKPEHEEPENNHSNRSEEHGDIPPTIQRIITYMKKQAPYIPAHSHYSATIGPAHMEDIPYKGIFTNNLPTKVVVHQAKLVVHINNTSGKAVKLQTNININTRMPRPITSSKYVQKITDLAPHMKLNTEEYRKTEEHIKEWNEKHGDKYTQRDDKPPPSTTLEDLEKMQAQFDFKEYQDSKYIPIDHTKITFTSYPSFGEHPFTEKTDKLTIFLCYILIAMGQNLHLQELTTSELAVILQDFEGKKVTNLKRKMDTAYSTNNIHKLYNKLPLQICHHLHIDLSHAFNNIDNLRRTKKKGPQARGYHTMEPAILRNVTIKTQAWSTLLYYSQSLIKELAKTFGQHPYFHNTLNPVVHFEEIPAQLQGMPPKLLEQILEPQDPKTREVKLKNRVKNRQEFEDILLPTTSTYQDREYDFQQFKEEALENYDKLNKKAEEQVRPPTHPQIYKTLSIDQLKTPEEIQEFVKYATSPSALHNFLKEQLPPSTDQIIPIGTFLKTLSRAKMVIYNNPEEAIADYIPNQLRDQFNQFFNMFKDKAFISASAKLRLPDYPQMYVWNTEDEPSPLHDTKLGIVLPKWLAFCSSQMLKEDDVILQPEFATELALLASLIFIYGQFTVSLHANHTGLFREDVFRAKTLLCSNTAIQNAKPPKSMGLTPSLDVEDKIEFMLEHGKAVRIHASPFLTTMTSIAKKRKSGNPLEFPPDSPILKHLLSLSRSKQEHLATQSQKIMKAREDLCTNIQQYQSHSQPHTRNIETRTPNISRQHLWTKSLPIEQFQQKYLNSEDNHRNITWDPPFSNREKDYILDQLDQLQQSRKYRQRQPTPKKTITWGSVLTIKYDAADQQTRMPTSPFFNQYFQTQEDHDLHQALNNYQQTGSKSKNLTQPRDRKLKRQADEDEYCIKYAFNTPLQTGKPRKGINPKAGRKQGLLMNAKVFHKLIEDTSNCALQAKIGPDHHLYDEITKICIKQVYSKESSIAQSSTLLQYHRQAASTENFMEQAIETIGTHTAKVRNISNQNTNTESPENWQQCQKALSLVIGTALLHTTENSHMLAAVGPILNRFMRARKHLQAYKLKTKHQQISQELIKGIWPERQQEWNSITMEEAKEHFKSWEELFKAIAIFYKYPLVVLEGVIIKKSLRAYFDILKVAVYKATQYDEETDIFGHMAACHESQEVFSTKSSANEFIKYILQQAKENQLEENLDYQKFTIKEILQIHKNFQEATKGQDAARYSKVHFQHLEMDVYWKKDPFRTIINTRHNNFLSRESNTSFQSQQDIRQSLANSHFFSSFDLASFYDSILTCPTSSLINTILYQGQEIALTIASMGSRNSCLWATAVVLSLLHHHNDELLLQPTYLPKPIGNQLTMTTSDEQLTAKQSYSMIPPLHLPGCEMIMQVINREQNQERQISPQHLISLTPEMKQQLKAGNKHQLIHQVTLIDDFCISTSTLPTATSEKQQIKQQLNIHLLCLKQLLMTTIECSRQPENSSRQFQPARFKLEKAHMFKTSVKFLNFIYIGNHQIINLDAFKGATNLDNLPNTGEELASRISFFTYFMTYIPNLRFLCGDLEAFAQKFPNHKILPWNEYPDIAQKYRNLATTSRALSGLTVLPNDLNKINFVVLSSDACNKTMAYAIGISLHPDPHQEKEANPNQTPNTTETQHKQAKLQLVKNYSCNLEPNLLNLPIATKECMSAVKTLTMEEPLLKLLRNRKIYHTIDNSVLFGLLEQLQNSKELANHFLAHTQFRDWVMRLHQLTTLYNITVLLVPSKLCLADVCTRKNDTIPANHNKGKASPEMKHSDKNPKSLCTMCSTCNVACQNTSAHSNCLYNIRNSNELNQHGPQLIQYKDTTEHNIINEGDHITYTTASTEFNPNTYKTLHLDKLVKVLDYNPQRSLDQNQAASAERTLNEEIQTLESMKDSGINEELQQIQEAQEALNTPPTTQNPTTSLESKKIKVQKIQENNNNPTPPTRRQYLYTMPQNMFQINIYGKVKRHPTKRNPQNTTILIFTGIRKSLRIASSLYANDLVGSHTEKLERRPNEVTFTENHGELSYLISSTPQDKLGKNSAGSPENFLPQLHEAIKIASYKSPGKEIILDGNSVQKFYNLTQNRIMTGLILVSRNFRSYFPQIGLIAWHKNQNSKDKGNYNQQLEVLIPIFKNKAKQGNIRLPLNDQGQCHDLINRIRDNTWLGHQAKIEIELPDGYKERYNNSDLSTTIAIHITQYQHYTRAISTEESTNTTTEPMKYTIEAESTHEPILDTLLAKRKLIIHQANDPFILPVLQQLKQAADQKKILQTEEGSVQLKWEDDIVFGKTAHSHNDLSWKPVLPEAMLIPEILAAHMLQKCSSPQKAVEQVKKIFFHKQHITSHYNLLTMSQKLLPCPRCIIRRPHTRAGDKLYAQSKSIVMSLKGLPCATIAHDIVYITNAQNQDYENKYLSVIICYGCGYTHLKLMDKATGHNIATHVLELIQTTGNVPHVLITDSANTELRGVLGQCIQTLNVIQLQANKKILEKTSDAPIQYNQPRPQESDNDTTDPRVDPEEFPTVLLEDLTQQQRNMLLQDFVESAPPLYPPTLSHSPVPYIDKQAYRSTSLGRLDSICGQIGVFLRKFITTQPQLLQDEHIQYLIQAFAFYHNFLHKDARTKQAPAKLHLGALRFFNTKAFLKRLQEYNTDSDPKPIKAIQTMLQTAQEHKEAQDNREKHEQNSQRQNIKTHGRLKSEKDIQELFPILSIVMLNTEYEHTKISQKPNLHGPHLVLARVPHKRTVYLYNLIEGHIYKRNFRAIKTLLPSQELFSTPNIMDWFHFHPLQLINKLSNSETTEPELTTEQYTTILKNLTKVFALLKPVLPTAYEAQKLIRLGDEEAENTTHTEDTDIVPTNVPTSQENNKSIPGKQRKAVQFQFQDDKTTENITDINTTTPNTTTDHREKETEETTNTGAHQHQETQGIDVIAPPTPTPPTPPDPETTRHSQRPKRARVLPKRYQDDS